VSYVGYVVVWLGVVDAFFEFFRGSSGKSG
jgi:hypothetical protein